MVNSQQATVGLQFNTTPPPFGQYPKERRFFYVFPRRCPEDEDVDWDYDDDYYDDDDVYDYDDGNDNDNDDDNDNAMTMTMRCMNSRHWLCLGLPTT